jgi:2,5-diketo-D-gluconate reductase B
MAEQEYLTVQGTRVPRVGFGTWQINGDRCREAVRDALEIGYRHLDTARAYGNEREVGEGLADSGVPREDVFLTTKVWMEDAAHDDVIASAHASLRDLGIDQLDLLLLHWPNPRVPIAETLGAMAELREQGLIRHAGVSNFPPRMLREALESGPLFTDQVEYHPYLGQDELLGICREADVMLTAYAPFAHGKLLREPVLTEIGAAHGKTAAQVCIRWLIDQPQVATIPKASSHENRVANFDVFDFRLTDEDRARIDALPKDRREFNPSWAPAWD